MTDFPSVCVPYSSGFFTLEWLLAKLFSRSVACTVARCAYALPFRFPRASPDLAIHRRFGSCKAMGITLNGSWQRQDGQRSPVKMVGSPRFSSSPPALISLPFPLARPSAGDGRA